MLTSEQLHRTWTLPVFSSPSQQSLYWCWCLFYHFYVGRRCYGRFSIPAAFGSVIILRSLCADVMTFWHHVRIADVLSALGTFPVQSTVESRTQIHYLVAVICHCSEGCYKRSVWKYISRVFTVIYRIIGFVNFVQRPPPFQITSKHKFKKN
jgi:hypothetical protein